MRIKSVELENIRSYKKEKIEFPEGSVVLSGDIGSGKTTVLLAIEFALFGLQPGQRGSSLLRHGEDKAKARVKIELDGEEIVIQRGLEKKGKSVSQVDSKIEKEDLEKEMSTTELKNKVLSILNYPKEFARKTNLLYRFTVYTPQEEMKQIIQEKPETRLNTLRHIFGINKYKKIRENTELYTKRLRKRIRNLEGRVEDLSEIKDSKKEKEKKVKKLEEEIEELEKKLKKKKEKRKDFEKEFEKIEEKQEEKKKYEREKEKLNIRIQNIKENIGNLEDEKAKLQSQIKDAKKVEFKQKELDKNKKELESIEKEIEEKNKEYTEIMSSIKSLNSKIDDANKVKDKISSLKQCPTCFQDVDEGYKKNIYREKDNQIEKYKRKIKEMNDKKKEKIEEIEKEKEKRKEKNEAIDKLKRRKIKQENLKEKEERLEKIEKQIKSNKKDKKMLKDQIKEMENHISKLKKYDQIAREKKKELDELREKEQKIRVNVAGKKKEKDMTEDRIEEIEEKIKKKKKLSEKRKKIGEIEDWLSSSFLEIILHTERNILLKLREEFSKLFNEWFNILVPEEFNVTLDEDFTPIIEQKDYQLSYEFLSGGERTAVALAYRLSLNQVINSLISKIKTKNLVILDEPTDGFSEEQLDKMRDVLNELDAEQLIIVSHEDKIESFVENILEFKKENGVTKVSNQSISNNV